MDAVPSLHILIPDGEFDHTLKVVRCLVRSSLAETVWVHVSGTGEIPRALRLSRHVAGLHFLGEGSSGVDRAQDLAEIASTIAADVIFPVSVAGARLIAQHRDLFGDCAIVPLAEVSIQERAGNKAQLVQVMEAHGIPHPPAIPLHPRPTLAERLASIPFPVLVKAAAGGGGTHIHRFDTPEAVLHFAQTPAADSREYIVQAYIQGSDIDISMLAVEGQVVAFTVQQSSGGDEAAFTPPEFIEFLDDPRVETVGRALMKALQFSGLAHIDLRYDRSRSSLYVLEINTRVWGSMLGSLRAGINFPELACRIAMGQSVSTPTYDNIQYAVGTLGLKRIGQTLQRRIPLRHSCMAYGVDDPLPDLSEFVRLKWERAKGVLGRNREPVSSRSGAPETVV